MPGVSNPDLLALGPLDHIPAKLFLPFILYFDTPDPQTALLTLRNGIDKLVSQLPWLAGDVIFHQAPDGPKGRMHIAPPQVPLSQVSMLQVKHFAHDEESRSHRVQAYLALPTFIPASEQRPVLRFQANVFPSKLVLAMSFWHNVVDGTGAGVILEALAECCRASAAQTDTPLAQTIATTHIPLRNHVSRFPAQCTTRLDHTVELGPPVFDPSTSTEQWNAVESALAFVVETTRYTFDPHTVAQLKDRCTQQLLSLSPESASWISSNDIITATLALCVDRVLPDFLMAVNLRNRVHPRLPDTYVGNMIFPIHDTIEPPTPLPWAAQAPTTAEERDLQRLAQLALRVRTLLSVMDETVAYSASAVVADHADWTTVEGRPAGIIPGLALVPGGCIFLPARTARMVDGGCATAPWEVCVTTLRTGDSEMLLQDPLFRRILA
ncbi:hypothetical protein BO86DRAFT_423442 [Aspergillus japonicus CBS 114.51]|uniref:Trichothecene 3-O-acetyltransferase-like N-terminal domain-containing protein n=1 Tax=Aspergillus japonicus CBS 114.51 TaxID=1448312 RepID=A0A8T8WK42_ASPJA|nr:hypothetical protein BO86DRAFT_423442 [Aspergillus japonicus CBS 114.51]RAH76083.1 hypothetical protein BO86DRAFT_423442 [Aspergillus japonicus CBS 114.51]